MTGNRLTSSRLRPRRLNNADIFPKPQPPRCGRLFVLEVIQTFLNVLKAGFDECARQQRLREFSLD